MVRPVHLQQRPPGSLSDVVRIVSLLLFACLSSHSLFGQYEMGPSDRERFEGYLISQDWDKLNCQVNHWLPRLDYAFRFQAGYYVDLPLKQFSGEKNVLRILTRITPEREGAEAKDLVQQFTLPPVPERTRAVLGVDGGFMVGEGRFHVALLLADNHRRACRAEWNFTVARSREERNVKVALEPGEVEALNRLRWSDALPPEPAAPRFTVMLDATPLDQRAPKLHYFDRMLLLNSLVSLMQRVHYSEIHVVAFNLDQQRILFDEADFGESAFRRLGHALNDLQLATTNVQVLSDPAGHLRLLAQLINAEAKAATPSRAVIFLGPVSRIQDRFPAAMLEHASAMPPVYYLEYHPFWVRDGEFADVLRNLTQACQGKTFRIHSPGELASAIEVLNRDFSQNRRATAAAPSSSP